MGALDDTSTGLTTAQAVARLHQDGPNVLPRARHRGRFRQLFGQLTHFFAVMLWVAGLLAVVAGMPQLGVAIFIVIVVNGVFAWAQEARAERAAERLQDLVPRRATVRRDDRLQTVDACDLVVGDVVRLAAGDRVAADMTVTSSTGLLVDSSTLTGESTPEEVAEGDLAATGSLIVGGEGWGTIVQTGINTRFARIAELTTSSTRPRTPLAKELDRVVRRIAMIALVVGAVFFGAAVGFGEGTSDGFLFAIGVTVALVPEGLLPTITLALAVGAQRMAKRHALVRRLDAVETLGSTTFICTDKTGTLTMNQMTVAEVWTPTGTARITGVGYAPEAAVSYSFGSREGVETLARNARTCSDGRITHTDTGWTPFGDPMEAAIDALAHRCAAADDEEVIGRAPFDSSRRRMSVVVQRGHDHVLIVKGAPESMLPISSSDDQPDTSPVSLATQRLAERGLRVLVVGARTLTADEWSPSVANLDSSIVELEHGVDVTGLLGLHDPPRPSVTAAISRCRQLGVGVVMLTGDHPATAAAIAREIGLSLDGVTVIRGSDLPDDVDRLADLVTHDGAVISRLDPEQKLRVARALQQRGHVVAMTGDGVNDGPALQAADVGVAMGESGTDVARGAADLVLLDDDFATIVAAIEEGRATYANVRRFLTYHLTDNVAELTPFVVWALSGGRIPLALGVLQILCLDIGTDLLPALGLGVEAAHGAKPPPVGSRLFDRLVLRRAFGLLGPTEAVIEMTAFFASFLAVGWRPGDPFPTGSTLAAASGAAFMAVVVCQMANAFACRSVSRPPWQLGWFTNRAIVAAVCFELGALAAFLGFGPLARLLEHSWPPLAGSLVAIAGFPAILAVDAIDKHRRHRRDALT